MPCAGALYGAGARHFAVAKIEEGIDVLSGYGKVMKKAASLKGKVPQVAVVVGNCAGAAATVAAMADVTVMAEGASYSVTPASVLSANGADKDVASAEYASSKGMVDVICASVCPASLSSNVSPQQIIGNNPPFKIAFAFLLIISSVSEKYCLLSE